MSLGTAQNQLDHAEKFARELRIEKDATEMGVRRDDLTGSQGFALRQLIYHCTAAVVAAIEDRRS
jgi:hypothetical protein